MSRHKDLKGIIKGQEDDEDAYYGDEYGDEDYGEEQSSKKQQKQQKKDKKKQKNQVPQPDQKQIDEIIQMFKGFFTKEQIVGTLKGNNMDAQLSIKSLQLRYDQNQKKNGGKNIKNELIIQEQKKIEQQKLELQKEEEDKQREKKIQEIVKKNESDHVQVDHETLNKIYPPINYKLPSENNQEQEELSKMLGIVIIGHVDSGKSTLMGHFLFLLGKVTKQTMHKYEKMSEEYGKGSFKWAWVMDQDEEERKRGVTIDLGVSYFDTPNRHFTILDAPGHSDFVPNMIKGAAQADCAILVIDSDVGCFESGFLGGGGTKEHAILARSLGVHQLIVAINKLDKVSWSQERYESIKDIILPFLLENGYQKDKIHFVPICAFEGINLVERPLNIEKLTWYEGKPCLLEVLDQLVLPKKQGQKPIRVCIYDFYEQKQGQSLIGDCVSAKVESGIIKEKDLVLLVPLNVITEVRGIEIQGKRHSYALPGTLCELQLHFPSNFDVSYIKAGHVLCDKSYPMHQVSEFRALIQAFDLDAPIIPGDVQIFSFSHKLSGKIKKLESIVNLKQEVLKKNPRFIMKKQYAIIKVKLDERAGLELFQNYTQLGRIAIRDGKKTLAQGKIIELF